MHFLFPLNPFEPKEADIPYQPEFDSLRKLGYGCSLFDFDMLDYQFRPVPSIPPNEPVLYRGWMLSPERYQKLLDRVKSFGGEMLTSAADYTRCHHLPGWYKTCRDLTPETYFFEFNDQLEKNISALNWDAYFIKDYVKSNSSAEGSIAKSAVEAVKIAKLIETYRGEVEGGIAVRRVESFLPNTEKRYFVFRQKPFSATGHIPKIVKTIADRIVAPFYSVDIVTNIDGVERLIEIGDGQVSDKKAWEIAPFVQMLTS